VRKVTLLLGGFLGQDVALESVLALDFARAGQRKTLLGTGLGLHFRHCGDEKRVKNCGGRLPRAGAPAYSGAETPEKLFSGLIGRRGSGLSSGLGFLRSLLATFLGLFRGGGLASGLGRYDGLGS
jgi:hypothetical protein